jgi:hypothetical protein
MNTGIHADNREEIADLWLKILGVGVERRKCPYCPGIGPVVVQSMWVGTQGCSILLLR